MAVYHCNEDTKVPSGAQLSYLFTLPYLAYILLLMLPKCYPSLEIRASHQVPDKTGEGKGLRQLS
jgi:hypothetical protein